MTARSYQFGNFSIDPATRELFHAGQQVALPPKSFDCIVYLIEHRERAVGRDELISAVWGRVDVNDALLTQTLLRARRAVGDTGSGQIAIRTVPRFGYRWIAPSEVIQDTDSGQAVVSSVLVHELTAPHEQAVAVDAPATSSMPTANALPAGAYLKIPKRKHARLALIAVLLLPLVVGAMLWRYKTAGRIDISADLIVVLPVTLAAQTPTSAWIRLGVMDYISSRLRQEGQLSVLPSERVVALLSEKTGDNDRAADLRTRIRQSTGAGTLIQPEARMDAEGWQVTLNVLEPDHNRVFSGHGDSPLVAAAQAADVLLAQIRHPSKGQHVAAPTQLTELQQRMDAALLDGDLATARALVAAAPAELRADPSVQVREAQLAFRAGQLDEAERQFSALQNRLHELPVEVQAKALMGLGAVAVRRGDYPSAEHRYAEALAALGPAGIPELTGVGYSGRGVARAAQNQYETALADFGRARVALERAGDSPGAAGVDANLSLLEARRNHWAQALQAADRAIAVFDRYGVRDYLAASLLTKTSALLALLELDAALDSSSRAWNLAQYLEDPLLIHSILQIRIESLLASGELRAADDLLAQAKPAVAPNMESEMQILRVRLALARGNGKTALAAMRPLFDREDPPTSANTLLLVQAALTANDAASAVDALARYDAAHAAKVDRVADSDDAMLEYTRALVAEATFDKTAADQHFARALANADRDGTPAERVHVGSRYIKFLLAQRELDRASAIAGELAPFAEHDLRAAQARVLLYRALDEHSLLSDAEIRARTLAGERDPERFAF